MVENKSKCVLSWSVLSSATNTRHNSFPKHFLVLFLHVERRICESFWKESLTSTSSHLHNAARTLSSASRCFQLSTNLDKDFCRYLLYCGKEQIECRLAWHRWKSTDLKLTDMFLCRNCCLYIISNNNWTEWSTIQGVVARVISKSDGREARGRFEFTSTITPWIVRHEIQLLINRIYNKFRN